QASVESSGRSAAKASPGWLPAEDLAGLEVEVGRIVDVRVGPVVEGDGEVVVAAGHVDGHGEVAEVDDRRLVERVLADGDRRLGESSEWTGRGEAARAGDDVRDLASVDASREALVEVSVAGQDGVGPKAGGS